MGIFKALRKGFGSSSHDLLTAGTPARATIKSFTDTGGREGADPRVVVDLEVSVEGKDPFLTQLTTAVPQVYLSKLVVGGPVGVRVDPSDPSKMVIDWAQA